MPTINRIVSQSGREGDWRRDKQILLSSLSDFGFYTFADLHYFDKNQTILATFPNFNTDDIVQGDTVAYWMPDETEPWGLQGGYARVYLEIAEDDTPTIQSMRQSITFGNEGDFIPAVDAETNTTIEYAIQDVKTLPFNTRGVSVDSAGEPTGWTYEVEGMAEEALPAEHDQFIASSYPYVFITSDTEIEDYWLSQGWYHEVTLTWIVLKRDIDLSDTDNLLDRKGLDWHPGLENQFSASTWQIIYPAWTDADIVINEARITRLDKQFRWE